MVGGVVRALGGGGDGHGPIRVASDRRPAAPSVVPV